MSGTTETLSKEQLAEMWGLLLILHRNSSSLTDEQIQQLLNVQEELKPLVYEVWRGFPYKLEQVQRYRAKKEKLNQLSAEELQRMQQKIRDKRAFALASDPNDEQNFKNRLKAVFEILS